MSLDFNHNAAYIAKKNEIAQGVRSRKRKLIELYSVATSANPLHLLRAPLEEPHSPALTLFLQQNDIEQGQYFNDASLPARRSVDSASSRAHQLSPETSKAFLTDPPTTLQSFDEQRPAHEPRQNGTTDHVDGMQGTDQLQIARKIPKQSSTPRRQSRDALQPASEPKTVMRFTGVVVNGSRSSPRHENLRLSLDADSPLNRQTSGQPSRPVSPPYSPGSEHMRNEMGHVATARVNGVTDGPDNILTPRRDTHDATGSSRDTSDHETFDDAEDGSAHVQRKSLDVVQPTSIAKKIEVPADNKVNSSSTETSPSTYTAKTTADSTATSPERTGSTRSNGLPASLSPQAKLVSSSRTFQGSVGPAGTEMIEPAEDSDRKVEQSKQSVISISSTNAALNPLADNKAGPTENERNVEVADAGGVPMDVDQLKTAPQSSTLKSSGPLQQHLLPVNRPPKRQLHHSPRRTNLVLSRPSTETSDTMRTLRKDLKQKKSSSQSYLKPLIQQQVFTSENFKSLDHLLTATSKTVSTSDFMASTREEQDLRVLDRTRNVQSSNRWSLRQLKPSVEPVQPHTHWDFLLSSVKWLRTDFKEEAKYRAAISKSMAEWCTEWVSAGPVERLALQVRNTITASQRIEFSSIETRVDHASKPDIKITETRTNSPRSGDNGIDYFASVPGEVRGRYKALKIDEKFLLEIPLYRPISSAKSENANRIGGHAREVDENAVPTALLDDQAPPENDKLAGSPDTDLEQEEEPPLPPESTACALFHPESQPLRARLTAPWIFKPPTAPMPPQPFYEHRSASQWSWEDDQLLKQYTKDFPSNWPLIADRTAPKSSFTSYIDRRTPWECYERLLAMEGPPNDAQARQYLRHFSYRIEKSRESFDKHQTAIREAAEQHAQNLGQPIPALPQKRFPTPTRVDRKPNKRFLALLDSARKLARKREQAAAKQLSQAQQEGQAQKPPPPRPGPVHPPSHFSRLKHEQEVKDQERVQQMRDQQRAMLEAQKKQPGNQPAQLSNGIGQQMRNRVTGGPSTAQLPIAANGQVQARQLPQQLSASMGLLNGPSASGQLAMSRPQANMQGTQQRLVPNIAGQSNPNAEAMRMVQQMQQQRALQQMNQQQQSMQNPFGRSSPSVPGANGLTSASMLAAFSNGTGYPLTLNDSVNTPVGQQMSNGTGSRLSPHIAQTPTFQQNNNQAQALSSGHVTAIVNLEHQIRLQNPSMSPKDVRQHATAQLKHMTSLSRQNAINAATGAHPQAAGAQHPAMRANAAGSQSPFPLVPNSQQLSTPQSSLQQQQTPFQGNALLSTPMNHTHGLSPVNMSVSAVSPQLLPQQAGQSLPQSQYSAQLRQQMFAQQQRQHPQQLQHGLSHQQNSIGNFAAGRANLAIGQSASPPASHASPAMSMAVPPFPGSDGSGMRRTSSAQSLVGGMPGAQASMRPPSRSVSAMGSGIGAGLEQQFTPAQMAQLQAQVQAQAQQAQAQQTPQQGAQRQIASMASPSPRPLSSSSHS